MGDVKVAGPGGGDADGAPAREGGAGGEAGNTGGGFTDYGSHSPGDFRRMTELWHRDENVGAISDAQLVEEALRRLKARQLQKAHAKESQSSIESGQEPPAEPMYDLRIWWPDDLGEWGWRKRVNIPPRAIIRWKTANLKGGKASEAKQRAPDSDARIAGDKITFTEGVHLRRMLDEGLGVFAGSNGLPAHTMIVVYAGFLYGGPLLCKHTTRAKEGSDHKVALRITRASMHPSVAGIDGDFVHAPSSGGNTYDLPYYVRNGGGNLLNSRSFTKSNCEFLLEYKNYEHHPIEELRVDDCYCPDDWPLGQRARPHTHTPSHRGTPSHPHTDSTPHTSPLLHSHPCPMRVLPSPSPKAECATTLTQEPS